MNILRFGWCGTITDDVPGVTAWFRDTLGLRPVRQDPDFGMLGLKMADHDYLEVFDSNDPEVASYGKGPVVGFVVDDVREARAELEAAGVEMVEDITWSPSIPGYGWFTFRAPDGNVYGIVQGSHIVEPSV